MHQYIYNAPHVEYDIHESGVHGVILSFSEIHDTLKWINYRKKKCIAVKTDYGYLTPKQVKLLAYGEKHLDLYGPGFSDRLHTDDKLRDSCELATTIGYSLHDKCPFCDSIIHSPFDNKH